MRRRILSSMVAVAAVAVVLFGTPLALGTGRLYASEEVARLQREATLAAGPLPVSDSKEDGLTKLPERARDRRLRVYNRNGNRVAGEGPGQGGQAVRRALSGKVGEAREAAELRVAVPVLSGKRVVGAVEGWVPLAEIDARTHRTWLAMAALGAVVLVVTAAIARRQSGRLAVPVADLAGALERLGGGDFSARVGHYGMTELDAAGAALEATSVRLGDALNRERAFSANASHQLATPLTGLRLTLESALLTPNADLRQAVEEAMGEVVRLQDTVAELLALARDTERQRNSVNLGHLAGGLDRSWRKVLASKGRDFFVAFEPDLPPLRCSPTAVREIVEVLVSNAVLHGAGAVTCRAHAAGEGVVIEVQDEGPGIAPESGDVFDRRSDRGRAGGIGLRLARSLAEAEGARLLIKRSHPRPVFALVLAAETTQPDGRSGEVLRPLNAR